MFVEVEDLEEEEEEQTSDSKDQLDEGDGTVASLEAKAETIEDEAITERLAEQNPQTGDPASTSAPIEPAEQVCLQPTVICMLISPSLLSRWSQMKKRRGQS